MWLNHCQTFFVTYSLVLMFIEIVFFTVYEPYINSVYHVFHCFSMHSISDLNDNQDYMECRSNLKNIYVKITYKPIWKLPLSLLCQKNNRILDKAKLLKRNVENFWNLCKLISHQEMLVSLKNFAKLVMQWYRKIFFISC